MVAMMALMQSCKDECKDVNCANGGSCIEGTCQCLEGFSGSNCDTRDIDVFINSWTGNLACDDGTSSLLVVEVTEVANSNTAVSIVVGADPALTANLEGGKLVIPEQDFTVSTTTITRSGSGEINASGGLVLNIASSVNGQADESCTFTGI